MNLFWLTGLWLMANLVIFDIGGLMDKAAIDGINGWW